MDGTEPLILQPTAPANLRPLLDEPGALLAEVARQSPVVVTSPQEVLRNVHSFTKVLAEFAIDARVFAAHKATRSRASIGCLHDVCGIDVASVAELHDTFEAGFIGSDIVASGPKNNQFLAELISSGATIALDSPEEAKRMIALLLPGQSCRCLVRLSRSLLNMPSITRGSRFGVDRGGLDEIVAISRSDARLQLSGVSFHLDTTSQAERAYAVSRALDELFWLQAQGFEASIIDIGGGFGTDHGLDAAQLDSLAVHMRTAARNGKLEDVAWQGYDYGLRQSSQLRGVDAAFSKNGAERLRELLEYTYKGQKIADSIAQNLVTLWLEPGAALFASSGIVAAEVLETRQLDGETIVVVDIHRNQITFNDSESPADPILLPLHDTPKEEHGAAVTLLGHLCLESDILSYRKIWFERLPRPGDVLVWLHMGAYASHFSASGAIGHPLSRRLFTTKHATSYTLKEDI